VELVEGEGEEEEKQKLKEDTAVCCGVISLPQYQFPLLGRQR